MELISVATDFSSRSDRAIMRAALLAKEHHCPLRLVHVIDDDQPRSVIEAHQTQAEALLEGISASLRELSDVESDSEIKLGEPFEQVAAAARDAKTSLLVMGSHRKQILRDQFRGTTVERTIRRSRCPVLVANSLPSIRYEGVLLTTDLSPESVEAVQVASKLPLVAGSRRTLLHVFEPLARDLLGRALVSARDISAYMKDEKSRAADALRSFSARAELTETKLLVQAAKRSIESDVLTATKKLGAQLVVVGTGQKRFLEALMLGSVAEGVLRDAECDVLVMPISQGKH